VFVPGATDIPAAPGALIITIPEPPDAPVPKLFPPPAPPPVLTVPGVPAAPLLPPAPPPPEPPEPTVPPG
jgi:hypothetical protein